jgi:hypothetical protein
VAWISVSCECCVLSSRDLSDGPIPSPEESYRLWCLTVCDLQTSRMRRPWHTLGCCVTTKREIAQYLPVFFEPQVMSMSLWLQRVTPLALPSLPHSSLLRNITQSV